MRDAPVPAAAASAAPALLTALDTRAAGGMEAVVVERVPMDASSSTSRPRERSASATVLCAVSPADVARARTCASLLTIARVRPRVSASRASRRKLIRPVPMRDPGGRTRTTLPSLAARRRATASVISSSRSRYQTLMTSRSLP